MYQHVFQHRLSFAEASAIMPAEGETMAEKPNAEQRRVQEGEVASVVERGAQPLPLRGELLSVVINLPTL